MKVYISSDHGGFVLKNKLISYLKSLNYDVEDLGPDKLNPTDDYPIYTVPLAEKVAREKYSMGVVVCRNGVGVSIAANKIAGIRCGLSWNPKHAASIRSDDDTNILSLPADYIDENQAKETVKAWLETPFKRAERFIRRINEIKELEKVHE